MDKSEIKPFTNLYGADLRSANLFNCKLPYFQIPQEGELIVYKKLKSNTICKLRIPPDARRTATLVGRKCRAEFAEVLEGCGKSIHSPHTLYKKGCIVYPDKYNPDPSIECTNGIHFFLTREEAERYG